jgi:multiple sugar transport system substrate-binding protein
VAAAIDPDQPLPIYVQLKTLLLEEILGGRYGHGGQLPTEHELCAQYGISRTPVHRALAELAEDGAIFRHRRRETFVNPHWVQHNSSRAELRIVVPEGPWAALVREACPAEATLNVAPLLLFALLNRYYVRGLFAGGVKG